MTQRRRSDQNATNYIGINNEDTGFVEPFFIRNTETAYTFAAKNFLRGVISFISCNAEHSDSCKIFCNRSTSALVKREIQGDLSLLFETTDREEAFLKELAMPWEEGGLQLWAEHMRGTANHRHEYEAILDRIRNIYDYDVIIFWGTNHIVSEYAKRNGITALFAELGPLRTPFRFASVLDKGVNGDAIIPELDDEDLKEYIAPNEVFFEGILSSELMNAPRLVEDKYVLIPLQVADDANILIHNAGQDYEESILLAAEAAGRLGKKVVVKTHPGARNYPHTQAAQDRLCSALRRMEKVDILDSPLDAKGYVSLLLHAEGIITFNSSLGFEGSLLGTPTCVIGKAGYAPAGVFAAQDEILHGKYVRGEWRSRLLALNTFMLDYYLIPFMDVFDPEVLLSHAEFWKKLEASDTDRARERTSLLSRFFGKRQPVSRSKELVAAFARSAPGGIKRGAALRARHSLQPI